MGRRNVLALAVVLILAFVVSGCSLLEDEGAATRPRVVTPVPTPTNGERLLIDLIAEEFGAEGGFDGGFDIDCMATETLSALGGVEGAIRFGISADSISDGQGPDGVAFPPDYAEPIADALMNCNVIDVFMDQLRQEVQLTADQTTCMSNSFDPDVIRDLFVASLETPGPDEPITPDSDAGIAIAAAMLEALATCDLVPEPTDGG